MVRNLTAGEFVSAGRPTPPWLLSKLLGWAGFAFWAGPVRVRKEGARVLSSGLKNIFPFLKMQIIQHLV
jgi:hypothetical protein